MKHVFQLSIVISSALLLLPPPAGAQPYGLPKTGQTSIFHAPVNYDLGDDGAIQIGYPLTGWRFQNNEGRTVTDFATGLMWQKAESSSQSILLRIMSVK